MIRRITFSLALFLVACSGGGDASGGIGGTGISQGPITGFGSFFVTETEWEVGPGGEVEIDGENGFSQSDLELGWVVEVEGERSADGSTGTATRVVFDDSIEGPLDAQPQARTGDTTFLIFGQRFIADRTTIYANTNFDAFRTLVAGSVVEVSGQPQVDPVLGSLVRATRVEPRGGVAQPSVTEVELKGTATNSIGTQFDIGPVTVRLNVAPCGPPQLDPPGLDLGANPFVEAKGIFLGPDEMCAQQVELEDERRDADNFEFEGFVDSVPTPTNTSFSLSGTLVDASGADVEFRPSDLIVEAGMRLEVEGNLVNGTLVARQVKLEGDVRIEAAVTSASADSFVVLGLTVAVDGNTIDEGGGFPSAGDFAEVRAFVDRASGTLVALRVRNRGPSQQDRDVRLRGTVERVDSLLNPRRLTILGIDFRADDSVGTQFQDLNDDSIPENTFYAQVKVGDLVEAKGDRSTDTVLDTAIEVGFED